MAYTLDPETGAPVPSGRRAKEDADGRWKIVSDTHAIQSVRRVAPPPPGVKGARLPATEDSVATDRGSASADAYQRDVVLQFPSPAGDAVMHAQTNADSTAWARELAVSKGFFFPDPPFLRENAEHRQLLDAAYKTVAEGIQAGDKTHHVTQVFHELRDVLAKKRDTIQLRDAATDGLYKLDIGAAQYLLQRDYQFPIGVKRDAFYLRWKGFKDVPAKYRNYYNLIEGRRADFEKQVKTYSKNPGRSYGDTADFRSRRQKDLDDIIKKYVDDKRLRREQYYRRRYATYAVLGSLSFVGTLVLAVDRLYSMLTGSKSSSDDAKDHKST
ncbi:hypothetical protein [Dyella sp.]|uniref:hypothetical protein n=1 Tax=Dyella sp. TaxID=1869338 RepID=UPI002FDB8427